MEALLQRVATAIERHRMFRRGDRVGVAVSGGADSVCLLHLLHELAAPWRLHLAVLHFDHHLRGDESRADAEFVRELAARLDLPFHLGEGDLAPGNLEQAARRARLDFFRRTITDQNLAAIATAHTRNDQAETVLFRFLRGSATAGLSGIRPVVAPGIVRPLLDVTRCEVERYLAERGIEWRTDSTNAALRFARNRIRHQLLPSLARDWNPAIVDTLTNTADWAQAEEAYWQTVIDPLAVEHLRHCDGGVVVQASALRDLPQAVARRLIRRAMELAKGDLRAVSFDHVEAVLRLANSPGGDGAVAAPQLNIRRSFDWLRFAESETPTTPADYRLAADVPGRFELPGGHSAISLELIENSETSELSHYVYNSGMGCLDWSRLSGPLELRNWKPGDQYQPMGSASPKKIKTLFERARIPIWRRRGWPVLTSGDSIVWVRHFGPAVGAAAGEATTAILKITDKGVSPEFGIEWRTGRVY